MAKSPATKKAEGQIEVVEAFKGFDKNWQCRGMQYAVGRYEHGRQLGRYEHGRQIGR